ncbi:hypothetical protein [Roseibium litorale]|uniref:Uncharacterized protein n=1 Tax=Roseibium litorale TaxID=2803841 RepID=A0ABR9CLW1_9HYPH|nr:hypothetical protein [Roseibium litorale]MBD8891703.1 hypothetical protein [Roseibium litorale]
MPDLQTPDNQARRAERLVVEGVRRWMAGYATNDASCWEMAWDLYAAELGKDRARRPVSELSCYARALKTHGTRSLCLFPYDCPKLCQDECLVMAFVAAAQQQNTEAQNTIAKALFHPQGREDALFAASEFGSALGECGLILAVVDPGSLPLEMCPLKKLGLPIRH